MNTIQHYLKGTKTDIPKTSVFIAHRLGTIKDCDCIFVMDNGVICESGSHDELLALKGVYFKLWDSQRDHKKDTDISGMV